VNSNEDPDPSVSERILQFRDRELRRQMQSELPRLSSFHQKLFSRQASITAAHLLQREVAVAARRGAVNAAENVLIGLTRVAADQSFHSVDQLSTDLVAEWRSIPTKLKAGSFLRTRKNLQMLLRVSLRFSYCRLY